MQVTGHNYAQAGSITSVPIPPLLHFANNAVVWVQACLVLASPLVSFAAGEPTIMDRMMDLLFASYLLLAALNCIFDRPTFRLLAGMTLIAAYGITGITGAFLNDNLSGFIYEAKLLVSLALFFCLLDKRPVISDFSVKLLFFAFTFAAVVFLVLLPGERLHLVNESNYLCMYIGIALFSWLSWKGRQIRLSTIVGLGIFTLFIIVATQSRTGAAFLVLTWLVYLYERFGFRTAMISSILFGIAAVTAAILAIALKAPIVQRFEELKDPSKVDRFIYMNEAAKIMKMRPAHENIIRVSYAEPVSTRVDAKMKWLTSKSEHGTEVGQLYPHHFHLAYLRILIGHGVVPFIIYLVAIPLIWRINRYLAIGIGVCSLSMSVPYLSLFFGALHLAMAFPNRRLSNPLYREIS